MFNFVLQSLILFSFFGIFVIAMRKIPLLSQIAAERKVDLKKRDFVAKLQGKIANFRKEKLEASIAKLAEKFLHKLRILALKVENLSSERLRKMKEKSQKLEMTKKEKIWEKIKNVRKKKLIS